MRRYTSVILVAALLLSALSGIWLIAQPSLERRETEGKQSQMVERIEADIQPRFAPEIAIYDEPDMLPEEFVEPAPEPEQITPKIRDSVPIGTELGILTIDSIELRLPVIEGTTPDGLKIAPGHVPETAYIGDTGNAVIAGHRNYAYGSMFNRLGEIELGDIISFTDINGETMSFEVFEIAEIEPDDQIAFIQPEDESIIPLYTCTPIYSATPRLLVRAAKIEGGIF